MTIVGVTSAIIPFALAFLLLSQPRTVSTRHTWTSRALGLLLVALGGAGIALNLLICRGQQDIYTHFADPNHSTPPCSAVEPPTSCRP
jgi:multisubunit Na+/H+ antiporter MnhB subunit